MAHTDIDWQQPPPLRLGCLGLMLNPDGDVLLVEKNYREGPRRFGLPGGCAHLGEDARTALRREIREELGIEVGLGRVLTTHYMPPTDHAAAGQNIVFDCGTYSHVPAEFTLGAELRAVHWVAPADIAGMVAPYTARRIAAALAAHDGGPVQYLVGGAQ